MLIVTHEMSFAKEVSDRVFYMDCQGIYESGTSKEIFETPQKERTKAFISRLKTLELEIHSAKFDLLGYFGRIDLFCVKYNIDRRRINRTQMIFEELVIYLLKNCFSASETPDILVNIGYAEKEDDLVIGITYNGAQTDPFAETEADEDEGLGLVMVQRMSKSVQYAVSNDKNVITVTLK
jgi:polar amino acid transport system ATP-binding protein